MRCHILLATLAFLGLMQACGGGGGSYALASVPKGTLALRFGSDSFPGYDHAYVSLEKVDASPDGSTWYSLGNVQQTLDLMALQNGNSALILPSTSVNAGTYTQFRITWATQTYPNSAFHAAYVYPSGSTLSQILSMPATTVVGGSVVVASNGSTTAQIMLSGQQAVQSRVSGTSTTYTFQATGGVYDLAASATITGYLAYNATPIAGSEVFAETVDGTGLATLQRRAFSNSSGTFVLEGLPINTLYFVASLPTGTTSAFPAVAATPVNAAAATTYTADLAFGAPVSPGSLTLTITPASAATQGTWGELRQTLLPAGSTTYQSLIVRSQPVVTGLTQDQATFPGLAPGSYGVAAQRSASGATPVLKNGTTVQVSAGATATAALVYP